MAYTQKSICPDCHNYIQHPIYAGGQCAADPVRIAQTYNSCVYFDPYTSENDRLVHQAWRQACDDMAADGGYVLEFDAEDVSRVRPVLPLWFKR